MKRPSQSALRRLIIICVSLVNWIALASAAERINHEGRILRPLPVVTNAVLFNTPEADAIVSALQIFPRDNPWNEDVSRRPRLSNSGAMISQIMSNLSSSRRTLRAFYEMNFVLVPDQQPLVPIDLITYPDESDPGPYPIPANLPVESWPAGTGGLSLFDWQRDLNGDGGDRHSIIVQPGTGAVWETWQTQLLVNNGHSNWQAANGAKFSLSSNALRPAGWTSADAAGLSMFAGLVRYDECERGMVEHAIRLIVARTRKAYIYPATHYASAYTSANLPAMGQRLRLKADFVIPDGWTKPEKAVLRALKKYGGLIADNGNFFSFSVAPDQRFPANAWSHFSSVSITNFEVIQTTGLTEGPRAPGSPTAWAGLDETVAAGASVPLKGAIAYAGGQPLTTRWRVYAGPGTVAFDDPGRTNATARFSTPGTYVLMLSAEDGVHAPAYDAVVFTVGESLRLEISREGETVVLQWGGGTPPFQVEHTDMLPPRMWANIATTTASRFVIPAGGWSGFYRVSGQ